MKKLYFICVVFLAGSVNAADVTRYPNEGSSLPIASAVEVDGTLYHSGVIPSAANPELERSEQAYWGDTEAQARSVFSKIEVSLIAKGFTMGDIVKLTVFLVGDPNAGGRMDFQGFMSAYTDYFGAHTNGLLPARSVVEVAGLVFPGMFVEIEIMASHSEK